MVVRGLPPEGVALRLLACIAPSLTLGVRDVAFDASRSPLPILSFHPSPHTMTERERWVVYPLLFLALGASLRDKLGGSLTAKRIVCQELRIEDEAAGNEQPRTLALIGRTEPSPNAPSVGELYVDGIVKVDGVVSSKEFQSGNQRIIPAPRYVPLPQDYIEALRAGRLRPQSAPQSTSPKHNAPPDAASPSSPPEQKGDVLPPSNESAQDAASDAAAGSEK